LTGARASGLTIVPTFDVTITSDANAATIMATINKAIAVYEASLADPITVTITFQEMTSGLGMSNYSYYNISYLDFYNHLLADKTTANDAVALAHLPGVLNNPVTGSSTININVANLKALGFSGYTSGLPGGVDGIVSLNTSLMNLSRPPGSGSKYDLLAVTEHEIDEVLGLGSTLPAVDDPFPEDLFRYDSTGTRAYTNSGDNAYFSLNAVTKLARFNQNAGGDYGDWWTAGAHTPQVQDAFATPGVTPDPWVELTALDAIGYDLVIPKLSIGSVTNHHATLSWPANMPGYLLQESTNLLSPAAWINSVSGTTNPVVVTNTAKLKVFRLHHP